MNKRKLGVLIRLCEHFETRDDPPEKKIQRLKDKLDSKHRWVSNSLLSVLSGNGYTNQDIIEIILICGKIDEAAIGSVLSLHIPFEKLKTMLSRGYILSSKHNEQRFIFQSDNVMQLYKQISSYYSETETTVLKEIICKQYICQIAVPLLSFLPPYVVSEILCFSSHIPNIAFGKLALWVNGVHNSMRKRRKQMFSYLEQED